ncbi:hypothetical protein G9H13_25855, partial [Escherichia coli]|nr:hypothetical protein [Escherichia coli]
LNNGDLFFLFAPAVMAFLLAREGVRYPHAVLLKAKPGCLPVPASAELTPHQEKDGINAVEFADNPHPLAGLPQNTICRAMT